MNFRRHAGPAILDSVTDQILKYVFELFVCDNRWQRIMSDRGAIFPDRRIQISLNPREQRFAVDWPGLTFAVSRLGILQQPIHKEPNFACAIRNEIQKFKDFRLLIAAKPAFEQLRIGCNRPQGFVQIVPNSICKPSQFLVGLPQLFFRPPRAQKGIHRRKQDGRFHRFHQIAVRTGFQTAHLMVGQDRRCGYVQDGSSRSLRIALELLADLKAAHIGKIDVKENQHGLILLPQTPGFPSQCRPR